MTIPPFPSQELAKLVLGYLAEEQLMTAYDEFLQASPYLDALRNEYDRIFMTSLRNILAEYRAVKIYVETCKPFLLRKKLVHCTNLLEVVKILVNYTDVNKLQTQDASDKIGLLKYNTSISKQVCEVCTSLNLASCVCKSKQNKLPGNSVSHEASLESSVETTALEDLPGNHVTTRKKITRAIEKDPSEIILNSSDVSRQSTSTYSTSNNGLHCNSQSSQTKSSESSSLNLSNMVKSTDTPECREKIEEFNNILNKVCKIKSNADTRLFSIPESQTLGNSFQDFATGVNGNVVSGHENRNIPVPDSSTSENSIAQTFVKGCNIPRDVPNDVNEHTGIQTSNTYPYPRIKPKSNDQKIKIISDIKVDSPFTAMHNATSTPLMQTILINGTPAYKQKLPVPNNNYTKDEIMAMPTIIVVPTSGPPQKLPQTQHKLSQKNKNVKTKTTSSNKLLGPLVIDVSSPVTTKNQDSEVSQAGIETGLVKTVDPIKNASVPKDTTISGSLQTNTPQILPPMRKSSSTPRRNSHIRVLDFTTPRRILHETINEKVPEEINSQSVEIVVSRSPNVVMAEPSNCINNFVDMSAVKVHRIETCHITSLNGNNKIEQKPPKKSNWDADLRTLAIAGEKVTKVVEEKKPRIRNSKKKSSKSDKQKLNKSEVLKQSTESIEPKKSKNKRKSSPRVQKSKRKKLEEEEELYNDSSKDDQSKVPVVKPSFNIVYTQQDNAKTIDNQNKLSNEGTNETPEAERISLQNEIGAKLNISDFLETPYKQALYDIQMETPKFLGSVLPDEPISDIKIMSIPTPRFFDTPKPTIGTPYASRGTDYSSGGSYYKPDEQDYLRIPDLECPVTSSSSKEEPHIDIPNEKENESKKSSRPVRKCAKNVSYKVHNTKSKTVDDKTEANSTCSESTSLNDSLDGSIPVGKPPKTPSINKSKLNSKSETKKKLESGKKRKSPMKRDKSNTFMKIKPRRVTPIKENSKNASRKSTVSRTNSPKTLAKKRLSGKEKTIQITPIVVSAPTKSRRKSSTPRKLHCTKQFNSESSADSPEININAKINSTRDHSAVTSQDSDTEHLALRWSDDGSQDATKPRVSECEDINKIKEYIETSVLTKIDYIEPKGNLQVDLIKRGFDAETAKIIERDLLDTPTEVNLNHHTYVQIPETSNETVETKSAETHTTVSIVQEPEPTEEGDDGEEDDLELSVYECNEESDNYICISEAKETPKGDPVTLKEAWSMEVCIEDVAVRLRATNFDQLFEEVPENDEDLSYGFKETEVAVSSITNIDTLYTPLKDRRTQCYEIFDSTLTSLDTPLKLSSPKDKILETTEIEIEIEEEKVEVKHKLEAKKRKRLQGSTSSEESLNECKKTKPETEYLFNSANIQNIDIESVLKKLHGP